MSLSDRFTAKELDKIKPWDFPEVGEGSDEFRHPNDRFESEPESEKVNVPTAEELEAMLAQAQKEAADQGLKEGRERGFKEGYKKGELESKKLLQQAMQEKVAQFNQLLNELENPIKDLSEEVEEELVNLALAVARQLIRRELKTEPGEIVAVVKEALSALPSTARGIKLILNPSDAELVKEAFVVAEEESRWRIVEDPTITAGGCRVNSETSNIDATLENRLNTVIATALGGERHEDQN